MATPESTPESGGEKQAMRTYWAGKAPMWDRRADEIARLADRMNQPLLDAVGIEQGQVVLDLASGAGEPALSVARAVGPGGRVVATDMVPEMLAAARRRAGEESAKGTEKIARMDFEIADMEALPFPDAAFDRVTCRFGLMFCPHPERALAEARRVLRPGGRAGFMVWGPREDTTIFVVLAAAARAVFGDDPGFDLDTQFRLGAEGALTDRMSASGFADAKERELRFSPRVPVGHRFWEAQADMSLGSRLESASESERRAYHEAVEAELAAHRDGDSYQLYVHARIGLGKA
jgi:ubiquinone/menaquinone biosynthesis C-methylase UbiE